MLYRYTIGVNVYHVKIQMLYSAQGPKQPI